VSQAISQQTSRPLLYPQGRPLTEEHRVRCEQLVAACGQSAALELSLEELTVGGASPVVVLVELGSAKALIERRVAWEREYLGLNNASWLLYWDPAAAPEFLVKAGETGDLRGERSEALLWSVPAKGAFLILTPDTDPATMLERMAVLDVANRRRRATGNYSARAEESPTNLVEEITSSRSLHGSLSAPAGGVSDAPPSSKRLSVRSPGAAAALPHPAQTRVVEESTNSWRRPMPSTRPFAPPPPSPSAVQNAPPRDVTSSRPDNPPPSSATELDPPSSRRDELSPPSSSRPGASRPFNDPPSRPDAAVARIQLVKRKVPEGGAPGKGS